MSTVEVNMENFDSEVLSSEKPVLLDFFASWCSPCKALSPTVEKLAEDYSNEYKVCKIDVNAQPELAKRFRHMRAEPDTPKLLNFTHPCAFFVSPYASMTSPKKHPIARKLQ